MSDTEWQPISRAQQEIIIDNGAVIAVENTPTTTVFHVRTEGGKVIKILQNYTGAAFIEKQEARK